MIDNVEFIPEFVEEARGHIKIFEKGLLTITKGDFDNDVINTLFRAVHSIKGTAGFFNLSKIVKLSHTMENLMGEVRSQNIELTSDMIDSLLVANDCIRGMVENVLESEETEITKEVLSICSFVPNFCPETSPLLNNDTPDNSTTSLESSSSLQSNQTVDLVENEKSNSLHSETTITNKSETHQEKLVEKGMHEREDHLIQDTTSLADDLHKDKHGKAANTQNSKFDDTVRVNVSLLNKLLNLASEMVLGRNQLLRSMEKYRCDETDIDHILQNIDMITTELQETVMQTRMQPLSNVFGKFPRLIRDLSKKLNKEIELTVVGDGIELDKSIIEGLADPLTHLIRNAADHGIETPNIREQNGKVRFGTIMLKAYHEGGYVNIDIKDDGDGINFEKIKRKALEKGLITKQDYLSISESEALKLLFEPGFSTSDKITDISGRGVGMDVVRSNIEKLGGSVEIFTQISKGTTFRLLLPLTLAIIPSVIVEIENQKFALPQVNLQEIVRIGASEIHKKIEYINNSEVIRLRGGLLPIIHLADVLGIKRTYIDEQTGQKVTEKRKTILGKRSSNSEIDGDPDFTEDIAQRSIKNNIKVLVIKIGTKKIGAIVDTIYGSEEILVKQLPYFVKDCVCYSGVTIMGDGKVAMILDPQGIIKKAHLRFSDKNDDKPRSNFLQEEIDLREQQSLILFKSTGEECFGMDLSQVSRVEKIFVDDIERVGEHEYIKFRGETLRLVHLESYLPITSKPSSKRVNYAIIPKFTHFPIGILVEDIIDTITTTIKINHDDMSTAGIIGSTIINNRIVLLLDVYDIFEKVAPEYFKNISLKYPNKSMSVLLVEDTPFFLKMEKNYLETSGYNVLTATNGKEGLQILKESLVDAVVCDIQMPVMDGFEMIKKVRNDEQLKHLPVIALTSLTGEKYIKEILDAGFDIYEQKLERVKLLENLEKLISKE